MVNGDEHDGVNIELDVYLRAVTADHAVRIIVQFMERTRPWFNERLKKLPDYDSQMVESGRFVLFPLPLGVIDRVRRVGSVESYWEHGTLEYVHLRRFCVRVGSTGMAPT